MLKLNEILGILKRIENYCIGELIYFTNFTYSYISIILIIELVFTNGKINLLMI
jgi:hypothetical protein